MAVQRAAKRDASRLTWLISKRTRIRLVSERASWTDTDPSKHAPTIFDGRRHVGGQISCLTQKHTLRKTLAKLDETDYNRAGSDSPVVYLKTPQKSITRGRKMEKRPSRLLDRVRDDIRLQHYSIRTEAACAGWVKWIVFPSTDSRRCFHNTRHPKDIGAAE